MHNIAHWRPAPGDSSTLVFAGNPDITCGPDHNNPDMYSVTDGGGTFVVLGATPQAAIAAYYTEMAQSLVTTRDRVKPEKRKRYRL